MSDTGIDTTEFRQVFNVETDQLFRRRLFWFTATLLSFSVIMTGLGIFVGFAALSVGDEGEQTRLENLYQILFATTSPPAWKVGLALTFQLLWFVAYGSALVASLKRHLSARLVISLSIALIVFEGLDQVGLRVSGLKMTGLGQFIVVYFIACCVFPWKPKQALIPIAIVLPVSFLSQVAFENGGFGSQLILLVLAAAMMTPGVLVSWWKHSQRLQTTSNRFLSQRYGMLRQELAYARQIHEAMFPEPKQTGEVRFTYRYEPMRQIGGDYLHAHAVVTPEGHEELSLVILDVTGHGIPAALTVNRLYGEIDLRFADNPGLSPGDLLGHLNRYVNLTLARHSIYATALCIRVNTGTGEVSYASGGHPPAFLKGSDGTLSELASTTFVLGACPAEDFDPQTTTVRFKPGDTIVAYTDGATEARAPDGRMLRIDGLRGAPIPGPVKPQPGEWPEHLLRLVANHRGGTAPEDDTLLVEIYRPLSSADAGEPDPG